MTDITNSSHFNAQYIHIFTERLSHVSSGRCGEEDVMFSDFLDRSGF